MTLSKELLNHLRGKGWIMGGVLEREDFFNKNGFLSKPSTIARTLRTLSEKDKDGNSTIEKDDTGVAIRYFYNGARVVSEELGSAFDEAELKRQEVNYSKQTLNI